MLCGAARCLVCPIEGNREASVQPKLPFIQPLNILMFSFLSAQQKFSLLSGMSFSGGFWHLAALTRDAAGSE